MNRFKPDPKFTFETFLYNQKNAYPIQTAKELIDTPFEQGNPFVIIGEQGSGKSHLLKAVANRFHNRQVQDILLLRPEESLLALQQEKANGHHLADRLSTSEVLMIDDFHLLTQNSLLQTALMPCLNKRLQDKLPIILTCCGKLSEQENLKKELVSRMQTGVLVEIQKPDLDIRIQFLKKQNAHHKLDLTEKDFFDIATSCVDFKKIQVMIYSLLVYNELEGKRADRQTVISQKLKQINNGPDCQKIISVVADHFQILPRDLLSPKRGRAIVLARHIALYLCREMLGLTYAQLGEEFGGKHHSSVLYSIKKIKLLQAEKNEINKMLKKLKQACRQG